MVMFPQCQVIFITLFILVYLSGRVREEIALQKVRQARNAVFAVM